MVPTKPFSAPRVYECRSRFRAPLPFAYAWCTDFTPGDSALRGETFTRRILETKPRRVVFEDLADEPSGWTWSRYVVTLHPPSGWHAEAFGSHRMWSIEYHLSEGPRGSTEFWFRGVRRATALAGKNPPKAELEHELRTMWGKLGRALERDYRASLKRRSKR